MSQKITRIFAMMILFVSITLVAYGCSSMQIKGVQVMLEQSRSHEDCIELTSAELLHYSFKATRPVNFNVHYHEEDNVTFSVSKDNTISEEGTFTPEKKQFYCLMWTNVFPETVRLSYTYRVEKASVKR